MIYRPGRSLVVRYRAVADDPTATRRVLDVCLETRTEPPAAKPAVESFGDRYRLADPVAVEGCSAVWVFPHDPAMPHLADAAWPDTVRPRLEQRPLRVSITPLRYRPRRRAVLRYRLRHRGSRPAEELYAKVLRTLAAQRLRDLTAHLESALGRPAVTPSGLALSLPDGWLDARTALSAPVAGTPLSRLLVEGGSLPRPARVAALFDDLRPLGEDLGDVPAHRHVRPPVEVAEITARLLTAIAPEVDDDVAAVVDAVRTGSAAADGPPPQLVHGDLYEAQVLIGEGFDLGLLDLDDAGIGDPALDAANLTAHLLALALVAPDARTHIAAYRQLLRDELLRRLDLAPGALAWREALVMLQLATGPFRTLRPDWPVRVARGVRVARRLIDTETP